MKTLIFEMKIACDVQSLFGFHAILKDIVTFFLLLEPLSSPIGWFIAYDMKKISAYRHKKIKEFLEKV